MSTDTSLLLMLQNPGEHSKLVTGVIGPKATQIGPLRALDGPAMDIAVGRKTREVIYVHNAAKNDAGSVQIVDVDTGNSRPVLQCQVGGCLSPTLDASTGKLAFVRLDAGETRTGMVMAERVRGTPPQPAFEQQGLAHPTWSEDGRYLAAFSPSTGEMYIHDYIENAILVLPTPGADVFAWSPKTAGEFAYVTTESLDERMLCQIWLANLITGEIKTISEVFEYAVTSLAWQPKGEMIAFTQRLPDLTSTGRQLRLLNPVTRHVHDLTQSAEWTYGGPVWSMDGSGVYLVRNSAHQTQSPTVVFVDVSNGKQQEILNNATLPHVLPIKSTP